MNVLVTGGLGFIGSHTVVELLNNNHNVFVIDNLINSNIKVKENIIKITGKIPEVFIFDLQNKEQLSNFFKNNKIDAVIHFAGLKAVGESNEKPLLYYTVNLNTSINLLENMEKFNINKLIFSSSATVYGKNKSPLSEELEIGRELTNPYGRTKYFIEEILKDFSKSKPDFEITTLRYFNPIGAHQSGLIGEYPKGIPNNLMPYITQVAIKKRPHLNIFGNDYDTIDGTGVRDYIHVSDLSQGHIAALIKSKPGFNAINLGTGNGTSVLQLVHAFEKISGQEIPYKILPRRDGDLDSLYADVSKAKEILNWEAKLSISDACRDSWNFQEKNNN